MRSRLILCTALFALVAFSVPVFAANPAPTPPAAVKTAPLSLNSASAKELEKLPGIGEKSAAAIVAYRTEKGPFKTVQELLKVKGVGQKTLEKIKPLVSVD